MDHNNIKELTMPYRIIFFILLAIIFSCFLTHGSALAQQAANSCDNKTCGPGYTPVVQSNGSCMCLHVDCISAENCPEPLKIATDCDSIEGCAPPQVIKP